MSSTEQCHIDELLPNPYNRDLAREKIDKIKEDIQSSGTVKPLVYAEIDNGGKPAKMVTDGHHRLVALKELGYKQVPIMQEGKDGIKTSAPKQEVEKVNKDAASSAVKPKRKLGRAEVKILAREVAKVWKTKSHNDLNKRATYPVRVRQPEPQMAQASNQGDQAKVDSIVQELINMSAALQAIQQTANTQGILTEEELNQIVIPLSMEVQNMLQAVQSSDDFREEEATPFAGEETPEEEMAEHGKPEEDESDPREEQEHEEQETSETEEPEEDESEEEKPKPSSRIPKKKPGNGPRRQVGTAERDLENPATTFYEKSNTENDINKGPFGIGGSGKGWKGDPEGHAESARERWRLEGVPPGGRQKPVGQQRRPASDAALAIPKAAKDLAVKTAERAGRTLARLSGDAIADIGFQAFGTLAGIVAYRYLTGQSTGVGTMIALGQTGLKDALKRSFQLRRIDELTRHKKLGNLAQTVKQWASKT